jgi:hypothetical protein
VRSSVARHAAAYHTCLHVCWDTLACICMLRTQLVQDPHKCTPPSMLPAPDTHGITKCIMSVDAPTSWPYTGPPQSKCRGLGACNAWGARKKATQQLIVPGAT